MRETQVLRGIKHAKSSIQLSYVYIRYLQVLAKIVGKAHFLLFASGAY